MLRQTVLPPRIETRILQQHRAAQECKSKCRQTCAGNGHEGKWEKVALACPTCERKTVAKYTLPSQGLLAYGPKSVLLSGFDSLAAGS